MTLVILVGPIYQFTSIANYMLIWFSAFRIVDSNGLFYFHYETRMGIILHTIRVNLRHPNTTSTFPFPGNPGMQFQDPT